MSPAKLDRCVKSVEKKIQKGEIPKFFSKNGKKMKTSPWAICQSAFGLVKT